MVPKERRSFPRVTDGGLSLEVHSGDFDMITHTLNVSASGVYCKLEREIPLMSRVRLRLMIPDASSPDGTSRRLEVNGVVVREHPVIIDGVTRHFDAAIFFEDLSERDREAIKKYVWRKVPK